MPNPDRPIFFSLLGGTVGGVIVPLWVPYIGDIFGRASLASLFGLMVFSVGILGGTGPVIFGWIFDMMGSYSWAFAFAGLCYLTSMILVIFIRKEKRKVVGT